VADLKLPKRYIVLVADISLRSRTMYRTPVTHRAFFVLALLFVAAPPARSQRTTAPGAPTTSDVLIRAVRVFDGRRLAGQRDVLLHDGKISAIGASLAPPEGAEVIEGRGHTPLPGLIDAHVHAFGDGLRDALAFGVTTVLDQFTSVEMARTTRERQARDELNDVADLFSAGMLVTAPGGHGTEYGMEIPTIRSPGEAQAFVDARLAEGSQWIKIVYDDGHTYGLHIPTIDRATLAAVIAAAHARGTLAVVHIGDLHGAREALEAGADGLMHLFVDAAPDGDFAALAARRHAFVIPTLTVLESVTGTPSGAVLLADSALAPGISGDAATNLRLAFPRRAGSTNSLAFATTAVRALRSAKVPLLAGTDAANPGTWYGMSLHRELELLVQAGLTTSEALASATSVPASSFRLQDRGTIAVGQRADLVLVAGDPLTDIRDTRRIVAVWKRGQRMDRAGYLSRVAEARSAQKPAADLGDGRISDFEDGTPSSRFGAGWMVTTDQMMGGKSTATMRVVDGGAAGSARALLVEGRVDSALAIGWAGAMFSPAGQTFQPADLSSKKELRFRARGDGRSHLVMVFARSKGMRPILHPFVAGPEWTEVVIPFSAFDGIDGHDVMAIAFSAAPRAGAFRFLIDEVVLR
jgi:imidazolonepropionase-like amidohydrolase